MARHKANLMEEFKNNFMVGADKETIVNEQAKIFYSDHETKQDENFGHEHFRPEIDRGILRKILNIFFYFLSLVLFTFQKRDY